jgi:hypothetical protein
MGATTTSRRLIILQLLSLWKCIELMGVAAFIPSITTRKRIQTSYSLDSTSTVSTPEVKTAEHVSKLSLKGDDSFHVIADLTASTLVRSDMRRDAKGQDSKPSGSSATNWIDEASSFALQQALNKMYLKVRVGMRFEFLITTMVLSHSGM